MPPWREATTSDGKVYYYNEDTGESSWTKPETAEVVKPPPPPPPPPAWREALSRRNNKSYYYNELTGEASWIRPAEHELIKPPPPPSTPPPNPIETDGPAEKPPAPARPEWDEQGQPIVYDEDGQPSGGVVVKPKRTPPFVAPPVPFPAAYPPYAPYAPYGGAPYSYPPQQQPYGYDYSYTQPAKEVPIPPEPGGKLFILRKVRCCQCGRLGLARPWTVPHAQRCIPLGVSTCFGTSAVEPHFCHSLRSIKRSHALPPRDTLPSHGVVAL